MTSRISDMSLNLSIPIERYGNALADTLMMVGVSGGIALAAGIPLAVLLIVTAPGGFLASPRTHRALGSVINGFRATPFIVLLVALNGNGQIQRHIRDP